MAKRRSQDELLGPAPKPPGVLRQIGGMTASGLSKAANVLDLPGSMARDAIGGISTGNWSKYNPLDQLLSPTREINRTSGRDLNRLMGFAGKKDTYGNWWGGLATEIAADPLTYLGGLGVAKSLAGKVMANAGIHGLEAARIATAASKAGKFKGIGPEAVRKGANSYWDWVGPREANWGLTGNLIKEFAPEQFKRLESVAKYQKVPFDLANNMDAPMGALTKFWPAGDAGLIGTGKVGQRIARGMDVAGDLLRHTAIPMTGIRPVGDLMNLVSEKAAKAVTARDLQAAYSGHYAKEGARYEANLLTAKWANDLKRIGHKDTDIFEVRNWFEFPHAAPPEAQPLVAEVRQYLDRIPGIAKELGVKIGDVTPKMRAAGSQADYFMRHIAEGIVTGKKSAGKMFDPNSMAELARQEWTLGSKGGTKALSTMAMDPTLEAIFQRGKNPKSAERYIKRRYGSNLPEHYLDNEQIERLKGMGVEPTVENAMRLVKGVTGTKEADVIKFRDLLKARGNLSQREADAITGVWRGWAEGYLGKGFGKVIKETVKGVRQGVNPPASALFQESEQAPIFYSKLFDEALGLKGKIGWDQLKATLKNKGVKDEEVIDSGLEAFMAGKKSVDQDEILAYLHDNAIEIEEVTKGGKQADQRMIELEQLQDQRGLNDQEAAELRSIYGGEYGPRGATKFGQYTLPGGENYRELLLKLPPKKRLKELPPHMTPIEVPGDSGSLSWTKAADGTLMSDGFDMTIRQVGDGHFKVYVEGDHLFDADSLESAQKMAREYVNDEFGSSAPHWRIAAGNGEWYIGGTRDEVIRNAINDMNAGGAQAYRSSHWDEPNVLSHIRFHDRTDAAGKKVLHIEEIQSDLHQQGRKAGYKGGKEKGFEYREPDVGDLDALRPVQTENFGGRGEAVWQVADGRGDLADSLGFGTREEAISHIRSIMANIDRHKVPDAPFKKSWPMLSVKRMIRYAAENGYDRIAWTPGAEQAARYDLSKQIDNISWAKSPDSGERLVYILPKGADDAINLHLNADGTVKSGPRGMEGKGLDEIIGKEHAEKIMAGDTGNLEGKGLEIGGEGMKGFYDQILPAEVNKYIKKYGSKVGQTEIEVPKSSMINEDLGISGGFPRISEYKRLHSFDITDAMRKEVLEKSQPLYQKAGQQIKGAVDFGADGKAILYAFQSTDISTHIHELAHVMRRHLTAEDQKIADTFVGATGAWSRDQEEKFARGFENYIRTGQAPDSLLAKVFERLQKWMASIYQSIAGSEIDVQLSPEIRELYGRLVGGQPKGLRRDVMGLMPRDTYEAAAKSLRAMSPELRKAGIYGNHPVNDFAASAVGTMEKIAASKVALERILDSVVQAGSGTTPLKSVLGKGGLDLDIGDGTYGAGKWLADRGIQDAENAHIPAETARFLTQMAGDFKGGTEPVRAMVKLYDDIHNFTKIVFTNMDPVRFNVRNRTSGYVANQLAGLDQIASGASSDANKLIRGQAIEGASKNPFIIEEAQKRGIQNLDDARATEILGEMAFAREATGSYGVSAVHHPQAGQMGGRLDDIIQGIPGGHPFSWSQVGSKLAGGFGKSGTTWNPFTSYRGVGGADKTKQALAAAGEDVSFYAESMNRLAPFWALLQNGVHPDEAIRRVLQAQVGYQGRFYTAFEKQFLKRIFLFYSFAKGQIPFTLQQLHDAPGGPLAQALRGISNAKSEDDLTPQHVAETAAIPAGNLPFMQPLEAGAKRYVTGLGMGFEDPVQFVGGPQNLGMEAISRMNPLIKGPLEQVFGQSTFQRAPGGGGRELTDLDPVLGRTLANIGHMTGLKDSSDKSPVRYPGSNYIEHILSNSPVSNILTKARTATDPRKGTTVKALNLMTGVKATDVSPAAQDSELRNRIRQLEKEMGGRSFTTTYLPDDVKKRLSPQQTEAYAQLRELEKLLGQRSKVRKAKN